MNGSNEQEQGATPSGSGCQPTASAANASSQSGIPSAFTPGPWLAEAADMFGDHNIVLPSTANDCRAVAAVVSNMREPSEVAANAFLVAAAPDMLAVNKAAGGILGAILGYMEEGGTMPAIEDIAAAYFATQDAIAKATGGAA